MSVLVESQYHGVPWGPRVLHVLLVSLTVGEGSRASPQNGRSFAMWGPDRGPWAGLCLWGRWW